jgi:hypothetical protein
MKVIVITKSYHSKYFFACLWDKPNNGYGKPMEVKELYFSSKRNDVHTDYGYNNRNGYGNFNSLREAIAKVKAIFPKVKRLKPTPIGYYIEVNDVVFISK